MADQKDAVYYARKFKKLIAATKTYQSLSPTERELYQIIWFKVRRKNNSRWIATDTVMLYIRGMTYQNILRSRPKLIKVGMIGYRSPYDSELRQRRSVYSLSHDWLLEEDKELREAILEFYNETRKDDNFHKKCSSHPSLIKILRILKESLYWGF